MLHHVALCNVSRMLLSVAMLAVVWPAAPARAQSDGSAPVVTPSSGTVDHDRVAPRAQAVWIDGEIQLDGRLDEDMWGTAPAMTEFTQREPNEGEAATQRTEVRFCVRRPEPLCRRSNV